MHPFDFRRVQRDDFAFCWPLYRDALQPLSVGLFVWDDPTQQQRVREALADEGASILQAAGDDAGWLHCTETRFAIHLGHLYLSPDKRNQGLGTSFLTWMSDRARRKGKEFTLDVIKNNPALALYKRLGFRPVQTQAYTVILGL
ncbi:Ribosomal protein S18 acetylase RimI [Enhydrobacter aerosaccus]|uniref:Ribosomal protein S18 acetylase RimI n=1 Tax=Enhydrobacter aerosaccus TaxID=225324 RepID=A0A1T4T0K7_9HYPH|nr:GNAT family N-acetyltransferase [Enhydrobacter aerosaccus]SKA34030.1 Ribosomal protein S18 acetylase RimI [Enhydrobacter aerosaccus]